MTVDIRKLSSDSLVWRAAKSIEGMVDGTDCAVQAVEAVLKAVREPTEAMICAGTKADSDWTPSHHEVKVAWIAMIDEMLHT